MYFFTTPLPYSVTIPGNNFDFNLNDLKSFTSNSSYSTFTENKFLLQPKKSSAKILVTALIPASPKLQTKMNKIEFNS